MKTKYLQGHPSINFPESFALINFKDNIVNGITFLITEVHDGEGSFILMV